MARRVVRDGAEVQIRLADRVHGGAGDRGRRGQLIGDRAADGNHVVGDRERSGEGHVARVGEDVGVGDLGADGGEGLDVRGLDDAQSGRLVGVEGDVVCVGRDRRLTEDHRTRGGVGNGTAVDVGLDDRIARGAGDGFAGADARRCRRAGNGDLVVGDLERSGEGHVAGVLEGVRVVDRVAHGAVAGDVGGLLEAEVRALDRSERDGVGAGDRGILVVDARGGDVSQDARVEIRLGDDMLGRAPH